MGCGRRGVGGVGQGKFGRAKVGGCVAFGGQRGVLGQRGECGWGRVKAVLGGRSHGWLKEGLGWRFAGEGRGGQHERVGWVVVQWVG